MYAKLIISVTLISILKIDCYILQAESNYLKPKLERNNILNKGIWVKNKLQGRFMDKNSLGNFIFRPNSVDVENAIQSSFDNFGQSAIQDTPYVSNYVQRTRRSPDHIRKRRPRKSMKSAKVIKGSIEDSVVIKPKQVSDLKPTSVFNEYPYEVAIVLNNEFGKAVDKSKKETSKKELNNFKLEIQVENSTANNDVSKEVNVEEFKIVALNSTETNVIDSPKRSKKYGYGNEEMKRFYLAEDHNKTEHFNAILDKQERHISNDKFNRIWKGEAPENNNNFYKIVPKEPEKLKPVTEVGLVKVISMLTKTFKKIMKQHNQIKNIHDHLMDLNKDFDQKITELHSKFEDFDSKYSDMIQFNNKLTSFETEIKSQKQYFEMKQNQIQKSLTEFQEQQKKFLAQQKQFYAIQKLMLAQNEKINEKQHLIAQTQSQISHRQNNFARILKKTKLIISDNKSNHNDSQAKIPNKVEKTKTTVIPLATTRAPYTEIMKINLFAVPTMKNKLENQDAQIIKEKDEKQIDELVYKYYFNNTFIDSLMKSKIFSNFASNSNSVEIVNRSTLSKAKRDELETTVMIPLNNSVSDTPLKRERRWINHFSKNKYRHLNKHKNNKTKIVIAKDTKKDTDQVVDAKTSGLNEVKPIENKKDDPFSMMAMNFCKEIGHNGNDQSLKWCVEKALRKLKLMEINSFTPPTSPVTVMVKQEPLISDLTAEPPVGKEDNSKEETTPNAVSSLPETTQMMYHPAQSTTLEPVSKVTQLLVLSTPQVGFFPDNDELESKLRQYELIPDTEGNVYYDGSAHISDLKIADSGPMSDIIPGLVDSNSRVDIDPMTFTLQANRRAYVRRMNENIMNQMRSRGVGNN